EADQGVAAEGPPVGAGGSRDAAGQRCTGGRRAGTGGEEDRRGSAAVAHRAEGRNREERGRPAGRTAPGLREESGRARENQTEISPRCAGRVGWGGSLQPESQTPRHQLNSVTRTEARYKEGAWQCVRNCSASVLVQMSAPGLESGARPRSASGIDGVHR